MKFVQPLRSKEEVQRMLNVLCRNPRDCMLAKIGFSTALRVSDLLTLQVSDVKDRNFIEVKEKKTEKIKKHRLNDKVKNEIEKYVDGMDDQEYLFKSREGNNKPITRQQAHAIMKKAGDNCGLSKKYNIGTHTLRKTYARLVYDETKDIVLVQMMLNHSSPAITIKYLGIGQEEMDAFNESFSVF